MRIVIGGEDEVAFRIASAVMGDHEVVLVHGPDAPPARLERLDVEAVAGAVSSPEVLSRARIAKADLFVACAPEDEHNLVACVVARRLGAARTVCFFHREEWVRPVEGGGPSLAQAFGIDTVIWPAERLAREITDIVATPNALDVEVLDGGEVRLLKALVDPASEATGKAVREIGVPPGVVLVGLRRGEAMQLPRGDTRFEAGDRVIAMGDRRGVAALGGRLAAASTPRRGGSVAIVGGGNVGQMVAEGLEDEGGFQTRLIESDRRRCEELARRLRSTLVLQGDGTDLDLLESERIDTSDVLVAVTNRDEKNLLVSLLGKQMGIRRIVTRADRPVNERLFERVGIDSTRSARGSAVQAVVAQIVGGRRALLAEVEHGDARVIELTVPAGFPPTRLKDLHVPVFAIVGAIRRGRQTLIPRGGDALQGGDRVLVFCDRASEEAAREFFAMPASRGAHGKPDR